MDQKTGRFLYINGAWLASASADTIAVINPATEAIVANAAASCREDADKAVAAARLAFDLWSQASLNDRLDLLRRVSAGISARADELATTITSEM